MFDNDKLLGELERSIAHAELLTTAYTAALMAMDQSAPNFTDVELRLWHEMDALMELRVQLINRRDELSLVAQQLRATGLD